MRKEFKITRPASGSGTTVTCVINENGVRVSYSYKSSALRIGDSMRFADKEAMSLLAQARAEIDRAE